MEPATCPTSPALLPPHAGGCTGTWDIRHPSTAPLPLTCTHLLPLVTLGDLTKIGKSQKFTLSVDVEGGRLVLLRRQRDSQEDWTTFTHDRSEPGP